MSTRPIIKICCIASVEEALLAVNAGAAVLGLVSSMPSGPGVISDERIAEIAAAVADVADVALPTETFLLTALTDAQTIAAQHRAAGTTALQLVDQVPSEHLQRLRRLCPGVKLVQVIHVLGDESIGQARAAAPYVDALLLDSGNPNLAIKQLGGTGRAHDWATSRRIRDAVWPLPLFLAGGLNETNVAEAIHTVQPHGLDLCSSVRSGGALDAAKLRRFFNAAAAVSAP